MSLTSYPITRFGGLDLLTDPQEVGAERATDLLNVDLDNPGIVQTRDGWVLLGSAAAPSNYQAMGFYVTSAGVEYIVASDAATLRPYQSDGTAGTTQAGAATSNNAFARFGTPANTRLYVATGNYYRLDGAVWTLVAAPPINPNLLAVTANDNRMAIASNGLDAKVHFSNAGDPETFGVNDFVTLWPGDGEGITGLVRWRDMLFAFKKSRFAVFYSTSTSGTGTPIFNYRAVDAGVGCVLPGSVVAADDGVYFATLTGLYRTTGSDPVYLSKIIEPWLHRDISGPASITVAPTLAYDKRRIYMNYPQAGTQVIYDTRTGEWSVWNLAATSLLGVSWGSSFGEGLYLGDSVTKKIGYVTATTNTDNGTTIASHYQSGFYELSPGNRATIRWTKMWGDVAPTLNIYTNHATSDPLTRGQTPTIVENQTVRSYIHNKSYIGELFSYKFSSTTGPWAVNRIQHDIAETSKP